MYHPWSCFLLIVFINGCASTDGNRSLGTAPQTPDMAETYLQERQELFNQPYIDPLTDYLIEHQGDPDRTSTLQVVRKERDQRCAAVAAQYASEPATEQVLERYNIGYGYSCPEQVAAFAEQVKQRIPKRESEPQAVPEPEVTDQQPATALVDPGNGKQISDQALSDCYLLTAIRNFSAARKACREPADNGDARSQANMAMIAHAFEDYSSAFKWAEKAAPASREAAFLLGQMYASGQGVSQNTDRAVYWYKAAASQGHEKARAALDRYAKDVMDGNP